MKNTELIYEEEISNIMLRIGIFFDDFSIDDDMQDIFSSSLTFITFIIELEQEFNIEIPDEYINVERLGSLRQLDNILVELTSKRRGALNQKNPVKFFFSKLYHNIFHLKRKHLKY